MSDQNVFAVGFEYLLAVLFAALIWLLPAFLGVRLAKAKGLSPHWMWFGLWPGFGWIAYLCFRAAAPRKVSERDLPVSWIRDAENAIERKRTEEDQQRENALRHRREKHALGHDRVTRFMSLNEQILRSLRRLKSQSKLGVTIDSVPDKWCPEQEHPRTGDVRYRTCFMLLNDGWQHRSLAGGLTEHQSHVICESMICSAVGSLQIAGSSSRVNIFLLPCAGSDDKLIEPASTLFGSSRKGMFGLTGNIAGQELEPRPHVTRCYVFDTLLDKEIDEMLAHVLGIAPVIKLTSGFHAFTSYDVP
ncbi:MAG: hypothetical protein QOE82_940 [Thermoanaerobaculia bacterium]|nr:hypothetical protein [Thermoanaerobaculia bacterium]